MLAGLPGLSRALLVALVLLASGRLQVHALTPLSSWQPGFATFYGGAPDGVPVLSHVHRWRNARSLASAHVDKILMYATTSRTAASKHLLITPHTWLPLAGDSPYSPSFGTLDVRPSPPLPTQTVHLHKLACV